MPSATSTAAAATTLDPKALANLRALDPTGRNRLLERVVRAFENSAEKLLPQIRRGLDTGEYDTIRHVAHTLKSSSASVGATELSRTCAEIENRVREGRTEGIDVLVGAAIDHVASVRHALSQLDEVR